MNFKSVFTFVFCFALFACESNEPKGELGIRELRISMDSEDLGDLNNSYQAKRPYPAKLRIDNRSYTVDLHYAGKSTLDAYKKSFQIDLGDEDYNGMKSIRLSSQAVDTTMLRSQLGFEVFSLAGVESPKVEPVAVFLNEKYLGLYQMIEPVDSDFFERKGINVAELYKTKYANANFSMDFLVNLDEAYSIKLKPKDDSAIRLLWETVLRDDAESFEDLEKILDIDQYLRYMAAAVALKHWDGFNNNYFLVRPVGGRFQIVPWDLDRIYESDPWESHNIHGGNGWVVKLLSQDRYRIRYEEHLGTLLQTITDESLLDRLDGWQRNISLAYDVDPVLGASDRSYAYDDLRKNMSEWLEYLKGLESGL